MAPPVLNNEYYNVLRNRIHRFNSRYKDKLMFRTDDRISEDTFMSLFEGWQTISQEHAKNLDVKNLDESVVISEDLFDMLKLVATKMQDKLSALAFNKDLGEVFIEQGREHRDYTYLSHEILELCVLAMYTYTNFFQQCRYIEHNGIEPATGTRRAKELARAMFPEDWHIFEIPNESRELFENPLHNVMLQLQKDIYRDPENYQVHFGDNNDRPPYEIVKKQNDKARAQRYNEISRKIEQKKIDKENAIKQGFINDENRRILEEKRRNPQMGDYSVYHTFRDVLQKVMNDEKPMEGYEHFYAIFKQKLDIDENILNAQTLIYAMQEIEADISFDPTYYCEMALPIYRQLQSAAFESAARKCIEKKVPIDFNDVSRKVDEVMAALCCTANALEFQRGDEGARIAASEMLNGTFGGHSNPKFNEWMRAAAIEQVRTEYRNKGIEAFNANAEAIFNSYTENSVSSKRIADNARNAALGYTEYREAIESGKMEEDAFAQATMRANFIDKAYALEKRIETRYASRWSRFIRIVSYNRQVNALADMKEALGISPDTRVADIYFEDRLNNIVKDFSNPGMVHVGQKIFTKSKNDSATEHVRTMMKNALNGKDLPHVEDFTEDIKKSEESGLDYGGIETLIGQKRQKQLEEEEQKRKEEEARKKLEEEKQKKKEEEERRIKQEEEEKAERERLALEEKERLYNEKLNAVQKKVNELGQTREKLETERNKKIEETDRLIKSIPGKVQALEIEIDEIKLRISNLENEAQEISNFITQKYHEYIDVEFKEKSGNAVANFFSNLFFGDENEEKQQMISEKLENDKVLPEVQKALQHTNDQIEVEKKKLADAKLKIDELWREERKLRESKNVPFDLKNIVEDHRAAKDELEYLKNNKENIINTGEGIGFHAALFFDEEAFMARESLLRPSEYNDNGLRFTVVEDTDIQSNNSVAIEPPIKDNGKKEPQIGSVVKK